MFVGLQKRVISVSEGSWEELSERKVINQESKNG
jgi:hypothetical protein